MFVQTGIKINKELKKIRLGYFLSAAVDISNSFTSMMKKYIYLSVQINKHKVTNNMMEIRQINLNHWIYVKLFYLDSGQSVLQCVTLQWSSHREQLE